MAREALSKRRSLRGAALCGVAALVAFAAGDAQAKRSGVAKARVAPLSFEIPNSQMSPLLWSDVPGWADDDQLAALKAFQVSCRPISAQKKPSSDSKALGSSLREPCAAVASTTIADVAAARAFFESQFVPLRISKLGEIDGFVTGYYEPIIDGSRTRTDVYNVPVYRRPSNLFVRGQSQATVSMPNKGDVFRKIGRRKLVPFYDRGDIEDGKIAGRGLEIVYLKSQTDLLFTQIQGSARVRLEGGGTVRINYEAHNGFPYTPVGRILIERNIIPRDQMSMQRIRQWMEENPDGANELRRQNRSYVFFREVQLGENDEAVGAQGVPLTPGRSIAVDKALHVYGTPFFIEAELPIETEISKTPFRKLMVAQDTGSAIVGPARADIYLGAGAEAGRISGRFRHPARFVLLLPKSLDPVAQARFIPLPAARPSETIAKLFPPAAVAPAATDTAVPLPTPKPPEATAADKPAVAQATPPAEVVPLPEVRPLLPRLLPTYRYRHRNLYDPRWRRRYR